MKYFGKIYDYDNNFKSERLCRLCPFSTWEYTLRVDNIISPIFTHANFQVNLRATKKLNSRESAVEVEEN